MRIEFLLDYIQSDACKIDNKKKIIEAILHEEWEITDVNVREVAFIDLKSESGCWLSNIPARFFNSDMIVAEYKRLKAKEPVVPKKPKEEMRCKKFQPIYTTVEESKMLLELGLPKNSADCYYRNYAKQGEPRADVRFVLNGYDIITTIESCYSTFTEITPCWSVSRLIDIYKTCRTYKCDSFAFNTQYSLDHMLEFILALFKENQDRLNFEFLNEVF